MSNQIGEVNINLRMSLAQFKKDAKDGTEEASRATKQMSDQMRNDTMEARGTLMLLGEEMGVHIPRHLQRMIAGLPGVGPALAAAFSSVAVIALIEVIAKVIEHVKKWQEQAKQAAEAMVKFGDSGADSMLKLDAEILKLEAHIAELRGQHMKALELEMREIDAQTLEKISAEFKTLGKEADEAFTKMKVGWAMSLIGMGDDKGVEKVQEQLRTLLQNVEMFKEQGRKADIGALIEEQMTRAQKAYANAANGSEKYKEALEKLMVMLTTLQGVYAKVDDVGAGEKTKLGLEEQKKQLAEAAKKAKELAAAVEHISTPMRTLKERFQEKTETPFERIKREADDAEAKIRKMAADNPAAFKKAFPNDSVDTLVASMRKFADQAEDQALHAALNDLDKTLTHMGKQDLSKVLGDLPSVHAMPTLAADAHVPTTAQAELEKIKTDEQAAAEEARKVVTSIETANQKFEDQKAILQELRRQGLLTGEEYEKAMRKAAEGADKANKEWVKFGKSVGEDIAAASSMQESWSEAFRKIVIELVKLILQMTILKKLKESMDDEDSSGSGGSSFTSGILGGLFGGFKAEGGPLDSGKWYIAGEHGPEPIWGGGAGAFAAGYPTAAKSADAQPVVQNFNMHLHGVQDADGFRKSKSQIASELLAVMSEAHRRNKGGNR